MENSGRLSHLFLGVADKQLSGVEVSPDQSNQHEFNGVAALKRLLGAADREKFDAQFMWIADEGTSVSDTGFLTWYDARLAHPTRSEHRLYFPTNSVMSLARPEDQFFLCLTKQRTILAIVVPAGSTILAQLRWIFGASDGVQEDFEFVDLQDRKENIDFARTLILEELGVEINDLIDDSFDELLAPFGTTFPGTAEMSLLARSTLSELDARDDPDLVLETWMQREEMLFRRLERIVIGERLATGFAGTAGNTDVDGFLSFSLSVQNRRKSRAGRALEHHLAAIFRAFDLSFAQGATTENRSKPDFLFPSAIAYHDDNFSVANLAMAGAKTTCKDRWRQILSEAARIPRKHLITLEPAISQAQTSEMQSHNLQLVVPAGIHQSYASVQRDWLMSISEFVTLIRAVQQDAL